MSDGAYRRDMLRRLPLTWQLPSSKMCDTEHHAMYVAVDPQHRLRATFGRQAMPMTWDFAEAASFADAAGDFASGV